MATIQDIEQAIENLPPEELEKLRDWFARFDAAHWDEQIEADVQAGHLDKLGDKAIADFQSGRTTEL